MSGSKVLLRLYLLEDGRNGETGGLQRGNCFAQDAAGEHEAGGHAMRWLKVLTGSPSQATLSVIGKAILARLAVRPPMRFHFYCYWLAKRKRE